RQRAASGIGHSAGEIRPAHRGGERMTSRREEFPGRSQRGPALPQPGQAEARRGPGPPQRDPRIPATLAGLPPQIGIPASAVCVFVSGSLVAGWGHGTSDVDLYVVSTEPAQVAAAAELELGLSGQAVPVVSATGPGGLRYDVEHWT